MRYSQLHSFTTADRYGGVSHGNGVCWSIDLGLAMQTRVTERTVKFLGVDYHYERSLSVDSVTGQAAGRS